MERNLNYQAGTASVCITPDEPLWLAGYAARTAPARGRNSDLYADAYPPPARPASPTS